MAFDDEDDYTLPDAEADINEFSSQRRSPGAPLDFSAFADPVDETATAAPAPRAPRRQRQAAGVTPLDFSQFADPVDETAALRAVRPPADWPVGTAPSKPNALSRGFVSGLLQQNPEMTAETLEGLSHLAPDGIRDALTEASTKMRDVGKLSPEAYKTTAGSMWDIKSIDEALTWAGESVGQGVASTLPPMALGLGGAVMGGRLGGRMGAIGGGIGGAAAGSAMLNYGEIYKALKDEKVDPKRASELALYVTPITAGLDVVAPYAMVKHLIGLPDLKREAVRHIAKRIAQEGAKGAGREALTEAAQEAVKEITISLETGKPFWTVETAKKLIESGVAGGLTGSVLGSASGVRRDVPGARAQEPGQMPEPPEPAAVDLTPSPGTSETAPTDPTAPPAPTVTAAERRLLRKKGWEDEQIDGMNRAEIADELGEAAAQGIEAGTETQTENRTEIPDGEFLSEPDAADQAMADLSQMFGGTPAATLEGEILPPEPRPGGVPVPAGKVRGSEVIDAQAEPDAAGLLPDFSNQAIPAEGAGTRTSPVKVNDPLDVTRAAAQVADEPTPAQKEAENFKMGHIRWPGLGRAISIETKKGGTRKAADGSWTVPNFPANYGRIKGTKGADGQQVDAFMGEDVNAPNVFIIDQYDPKTGAFDEHKVMFGFADQAQAEAAYDAAFSDGSGPSRRLVTSPTNMKVLKAWLRDGRKKKAFGKAPAAPADTTAPAKDEFDAAFDSALDQTFGAEPVADATDAKATVEQTLQEAGIDPAQVDPADVQAAADVVAETGADPAQAFQEVMAGQITEATDGEVSESGAVSENVEGAQESGQQEEGEQLPGSGETREDQAGEAARTDEAGGLDFSDQADPVSETEQPGDAAEAQDAGVAEPVSVEKIKRAFGPGNFIQIDVGALPDGQFTYRGDYELKGLAGGTFGPTESFATRGLAIVDAVEKARGVIAFVGDPKHGADSQRTPHPQTAIKAARAMRAWLDKIVRKPKSEPQVEPTADELKTPYVETAIDKPAEASETKPRIEDAGEKIGGARKDQWSGGLSRDDIDGMSGAERHKNVTKDKVWPKIDYGQLVEEGVEPVAAYGIKLIYDRLPVAPQRGYDREVGLDHQIKYIAILNAIRSAVSTVKTWDDLRNVEEVVNEEITGRRGSWGTDEFGPAMAMRGKKVIYRHPAGLAWSDHRKAEEAVKQGFPNIEPWQRVFDVREDQVYDEKAAKWTDLKEWSVIRKKPRDGKWIVVRHLATKDEAVAAAKTAYENEGRGADDQKKEPSRPHLDNVRRVGPDVREGRDVSSEDFITDFGFRGVEFGNWVAGDERQKTVNLAYDALHDLARIFDVPAKALSLDGTLGVAFGARGKGGRFAAHYEPSYLVINMTKVQGAGSLAHEWAHALDHYLGETGSKNPYGGAPKSISGWDNVKVDEETYAGRKLENLTPRLNRAVNALMQALHFKPESDAQQHVRQQEIENRGTRGLKSWEEEAERVKALLRQGGNTRGLHARLKKAEQQIDVWKRHTERQLRAAATRKLVPTDYYTNAQAISGSGTYWFRPTEMFARAFESYVFDRLAGEDDGHVSQYLVQGVEPDRFGAGYKGNPYPAGDERASINTAFDEFVRALQATEGKHGQASRLTGQDREDWKTPTVEDITPKKEWSTPVVEDITPAKPITTDEKKDQLEDEMKALGEATDAMKSGEEKVNTAMVLAGKFAAHLRDGGEFGNILAARKMAREAGFEGDAKAVEEAMELAVVTLAREIVADRSDPKANFTALVDLYSRQPKLGTRTSTSMRDQAFSTPVPLAYVASRLANASEGWVLEPTAGNGALLIEVDPNEQSVTVNEINGQRALNLTAQGFRPTGGDASEQGAFDGEANKVDVVIANPPFGAVRQDGQSQVFDLSDIQQGYKTHEIDHAIAHRALVAMRDGGRAVLLLGGLAKTATSHEARSDGYNSKAKREFYKTIYDRYNVTDHFTVSGELYERQGAGWPVDVIVIEGRGKSSRKLPAVDVPRVLTTWGQLGELIDAVPGRRDGQARDDAQRTSEGRPGERDGRVRGGGERVSEPDAATGQSADVQPRSGDRAALAGGEGQQQPAGDERRDAERTGDQPDAERRPPRLDDFDAAFDAALDQTFGPQAGPKSSQAHRKPADTRSAAEVAKSAAKNVAESADAAMAGLVQLFGGGKTVGEGLSFDPETYKKAKPLFIAAAKKFAAFKDDIGELVKRMVGEMQRAYGLTRDGLEQMRPYLRKFMEEVRSGAVRLDGLTVLQTEPTVKPAKESQRARRTIGKNENGETLYEDGRNVRSYVENGMRYTEGFKEEMTERRVLVGRSVNRSLSNRRFLLASEVSALEGRAKSSAQATASSAAPAKAEQETDKQVTYKPQSKGGYGLGTLVPVNMQSAVADALSSLEARVGNIDKYVMDQLGYTANEFHTNFAAEQIDALALAIDNIERGKGAIIGDQTGIGKGRVNAAMIRWAIKHGRTPIFVTEKPNLYSDMYRDLSDIGIQSFLGDREPNILATNALDKDLPLGDDGKVILKKSSAAQKTVQFREAAADAKSYDVVFTTYNQMQTVKGQDTARRAFLERLAPNAVVIFDESHNAGGQGLAAIKAAKKKGATNRSGFARDLVETASGVFYSSATYAKRPDVMDLYSKTDMVMAVANKEDLGEAIAKGGVPMQQAVAAMLAKAGQYIRRERSFAGVDYNTPVVNVDQEQYDGISQGLALIQDFSVAMQVAAKKMSDDIKAEAEAVSGDNATGEAGAQSTLFTSVMHNIINQMLLAMKSGPAAQLAIEAVKRGEKPVITVANTMESFLSDYAVEMGIKPGEVLDADFSRVLQKYLDRTRTLIIKKPFSKDPVVRKYLTDKELGPAALAIYNRAKSHIESLVLTDLPVSPIDRIKQDLMDAGYKVGEITGRGTIIDYSGDEPILRARPGKETSIGGRLDTIRRFNNGELDVVLLNQSGATGLSLHASTTFKDQRQRHMMIAQAEANIDTHMQMLGRVHRTGQVIVPIYSQLVADIPAEKRPAAVLAKKMASLNANTTASRGGALTAKDVPDFMNEYGDQVAAVIIADDMTLYRRLGAPRGLIDEETGRVKPEDAMRKVTGRIPLLPLKDQEELYQRLEADYDALLQQKTAMGENALEAQTLDLKARPLERTEVVKAKSGSTSPFAMPVYIEKTSIVRQGKPYSPDEVIHRVANALAPDVIDDQHTIPLDQDLGAMLADLENVHRGEWGRLSAENERQRRTEALEDFIEFRRQQLADIDPENTDRIEKERTKLNGIRERFSAIHETLRIGARITLKTANGNFTSIVLKVERTGGTVNPLALSSWKATFALASAERQITLPFSRLFENGKSPSEDGSAIEVSPIGWVETPAQTIERFASMQAGTREERFIATGNILAAYDWLNMKGRIINYTDEKGSIRQGILTAKDFDLQEHYENKARPIRDPAEVVAWLKNNRNQIMWSEDNVVRLMLDMSRFHVTAEAAKRTGGVYFLDQKLTDMTQDFYKKGPVMTTDLYDPGDQLMVRIVERLQELGAVFVDRNEAKPPPSEKIEQPKRESDESYSTAPAGWESVDAADPWRMTDEEVTAVREIVRRVAGIDPVLAEIITIPKGSPGARAWGLTDDGQAQGAYEPARDAITIALRSAGPRTAYHEAFHRLQARFLTQQELALLARETERLRDILRKDIARRDAADRMDRKEIEAEAFAVYAMRRELGSNVNGLLRRAWTRIATILNRLRNALNGLGYQTVEDVFGRAFSGDVARRQPQRQTRGNAQFSVRRRAAGPDDLVPAPESWRAAMAQDKPWRERISEAFDALMLTPSRALWDRQIDLLRFQKASEVMNGPVPQSLDTYLAASLYPGLVGEKMKDAIKKLWHPVRDEMAKRGIGRDELHEYLYARHAPERNAKIREIDPANDAGSGMTDEEASEIMGGLMDRSEDFRAVAALIDHIVEHNRALALREGLVSEAMHDKWTEAYSHYVPLKGWEPGTVDLFEQESSPTSGAGFDTRGPESKRALGRFNRADDILANLLDQTQRTVIRAEKNRVGKTFLRFAQANKSPFYKIGLAEVKRRINPLTGMVEEYVTNLPIHLDRIFAVKVGGKTYFIEIKHEGLLLALKTLGADQMNPVLNGLWRLTREYSRFQTAKNPEFVFTNLIRDLQDAGFTLSGEETDRLLKRYVANLTNGKALFGAVLGVAEKGEGTRYRNYFEEWRSDGGKISHYGLKDIEQLRIDIEKDLKIAGESVGTTLLKSPVRWLNPINGKVVKFLEAVSDVTESTTRLAVYISAREVGMTRAKAAELSRRATVDFNRRGKYGTPINALYAFANAAIQGNIRLLRTLRKSHVARNVAMGIVVAGMIVTYWNMAMSPEDDEGKKAYEKRKYWERERNLILYWPGMNKDDVAYKMPLGYGLNVFWMMGEQLAMRLHGKVSTGEAVGNLLGTIAQAFNPLGSHGSFFDVGTWTKALFPTVARPLPELWGNSNWAGNPIHPRPMPWNRHLPKSDQHKALTHPAAVEVAKLLNKASGGNKFEPGWVDLYPDDLQYGWDFALGGFGRFINNTSGAIEDYVDGVGRPIEKTPFLRRFVVSDNSPAVQSDAYYKRREEHQAKGQRLRAAVKSRAEGTDDGSADAVIERLARETGARPGRNNRGLSVATEQVFRNSDQQLKAIRSEMDTIRKDTKLSRTEKKTQIDALRERMRSVMNDARARVPEQPAP